MSYISEIHKITNIRIICIISYYTNNTYIPKIYHLILFFNLKLKLKLNLKLKLKLNLKLKLKLNLKLKSKLK